jgi:hypothetical protein
MADRTRDAPVVFGAAASAGRALRTDFAAQIIARVSSSALRRGMRGGSRGWLYVAAGFQGLRILRSVAGRKEEVLRIKLQPGEAFEIRELKRTR